MKQTKKSDKIVGRRLKFVVVFSAILFILGAIGLLFISNLTDLSTVYPSWYILISLLLVFYVVFESFMLYYKKDITGTSIDNFSAFMRQNIVLFAVAAMLAFIVSPAVYLLRNIISIIKGFFGLIGNLFIALFSALSSIAFVLQKNIWVFYVIAVILIIIGIKYLIYSKFIKGRK